MSPDLVFHILDWRHPFGINFRAKLVRVGAPLRGVLSEDDNILGYGEGAGPCPSNLTKRLFDLLLVCALRRSQRRPDPTIAELARLDGWRQEPASIHTQIKRWTDGRALVLSKSRAQARTATITLLVTPENISYQDRLSAERYVEHLLPLTQSDGGRAQVELVLDDDLENFDHEDEGCLRKLLSKFLQVDLESVRIRRVRRGSTIVTVELTSASAHALLHAYERNPLDVIKALSPYVLRHLWRIPVQETELHSPPFQWGAGVLTEADWSNFGTGDPRAAALVYAAIRAQFDAISKSSVRMLRVTIDDLANNSFLRLWNWRGAPWPLARELLHHSARDFEYARSDRVISASVPLSAIRSINEPRSVAPEDGIIARMDLEALMREYALGRKPKQLEHLAHALFHLGASEELLFGALGVVGALGWRLPFSSDMRRNLRHFFEFLRLRGIRPGRKMKR